jgi:hypothetical protein
LGCPVPFSNVGCIELTEASRQTPDSSRLEQTTTFCSLYILISQSISQYQIHSASFVKKIYLYPSYYTSISIPSCHVGTNGKAGVVYTLLSSAASWFLSWPTCIGKWMDTDLTFSEIQYSLTCD